MAGSVESIPCVCSVRRWGIRASTVRSQSERSIQVQREIDGAPVATAGDMPTGAIDMCGYISAEGILCSGEAQSHFFLNPFKAAD